MHQPSLEVPRRDKWDPSRWRIKNHFSEETEEVTMRPPLALPRSRRRIGGDCYYQSLIDQMA